LPFAVKNPTPRTSLQSGTPKNLTFFVHFARFLISLLALLSAMSHGLKLTELMLNPTNAVDPNTQWFEIYNPLDVFSS
jgi:hypothetical protein